MHMFCCPLRALEGADAFAVARVVRATLDVALLTILRVPLPCTRLAFGRRPAQPRSLFDLGSLAILPQNFVATWDAL